MADQENASGTNSQQQAPAPVVIRQGGNGLGTVVAALIIAGAAIYAINVWSTTKKENCSREEPGAGHRTAEGGRRSGDGISPVTLKESWS